MLHGNKIQILSQNSILCNTVFDSCKHGNMQECNITSDKFKLVGFCISDYVIIIIALQHFVEHWPRFQFLNRMHGR
jgi:hypothetical protein